MSNPSRKILQLAKSITGAEQLDAIIQHLQDQKQSAARSPGKPPLPPELKRVRIAVSIARATSDFLNDLVAAHADPRSHVGTVLDELVERMRKEIEVGA